MQCSRDTSSLQARYWLIQCLREGRHNRSPYFTTLKSHFAYNYFYLHHTKLVKQDRRTFNNVGPFLQPLLQFYTWWKIFLAFIVVRTIIDFTYPTIRHQSSSHEIRWDYVKGTQITEHQTDMLKHMRCVNVLDATVKYISICMFSMCSTLSWTKRHNLLAPTWSAKSSLSLSLLSSARSSNFTQICYDLLTAFPVRAACKECCLMSPAVSPT